MMKCVVAFKPATSGIYQFFFFFKEDLFRVSKRVCIFYLGWLGWGGWSREGENL